ncbi:MAG: hypothetical protein ACT4TC_19340 [Myxococcaceae bacterium]
MHRVFLLSILFSVVALGQTPGTPPSPASSVPAFGTNEKLSDLSDAEKISRSSDGLGRMRNVLRDVLAKLEEARNTKDVVKLNCVNEKLIQIKGFLRISEQADVALQEAAAKRETAAGDHEFTKVTIARQKVEQLRGEAEECIGQLAFRTDEQAVVEVETPAGLPNLDPTNPTLPANVLVRPPPASPTD